MSLHPSHQAIPVAEIAEGPIGKCTPRMYLSRIEGGVNVEPFLKCVEVVFCLSR
jgi:hypothetical protein